jgi:carbonic anhydrase
MGRVRHTLTPAEAWAELLAGNERFVRGEMAHPSQDVDHRAALSAEQHPFAVVFGCSDSRVAAEIVFDRGLGDLFVVRTAGHVVDTTVVGSIEYGVQVLGASLVIVLGHDSCGAVAAAAEALATGRMPGGFVRAIVDRVIPSIVALPDADPGTGPGGTGAPSGQAVVGRHALTPAPEVLGREHVRHTVRMLMSYSAAVRTAVEDGRCALVGATYTLAEGRVRLVESTGPVEP